MTNPNINLPSNRKVDGIEPKFKGFENLSMDLEPELTEVGYKPRKKKDYLTGDSAYQVVIAILLLAGIGMLLGMMFFFSVASTPAHAEVRSAKECSTNRECCHFLGEYMNGSSAEIAGPCKKYL